MKQVLDWYHYCPSDKIRIESEPKNVLICSEITKLMSRYGEWGSIVTDGDGNVILNAEYAYCAKKLGYGVLSYAIPNDEVAEFLACMGIEYGKYNFDHLGVQTYHQFLAQPKRLSTDGRQSNTSILYEKYLIPRLQKSDSIIDIGAGRMAYVKLLKSKGYNIHAYEPSLMVKGANKLDMKGIIANILRAEHEVREHGLFDYCVLEAVINSVVDDEFEKAVLTACNAVLKADGTLVTCTRNLAYVEKAYDKTKLSAGAGDCLWYLDDKNYTLGVKTTPYLGSPSYTIVSPGGLTMTVPVDDMFVMKQLNPLDPFMRGLGVAESIADEVEIDEYAAKFQKRFFYNDATPPVVFLMPDATTEQRDAFLARWNQKHRGVENSHRAAALSGNVDVKELGSNDGKNLGFIESRTAMRDAVLEHFGVPREIMGITENSNRATADSAQYIYAKNVLTPRIRMREEAINKQLLPLFGDNLIWRFDPVIPYEKRKARKEAGEELSDTIGADEITDEITELLGEMKDAGAAAAEGSEDPCTVAGAAVTPEFVAQVMKALGESKAADTAPNNNDTGNADKELMTTACYMGAAAILHRIPKSPYPDDDKSILACPVCGSGEFLYNPDGAENAFCGQCGQAIKWED